MIRAAVISECGRFRYILRRIWDVSLPRLVFVMLNPSRADADLDDHTIRKCCAFARLFEYGSITVVNLYAYRATKPADLRRAGYPCGPDCDEWIRIALDEGDGTAVCAWGVNARRLARPDEVLALIRGQGVRPLALQLTADGVPCHPLMLPYSCSLIDIPAQGGAST